MDRMDEIVALCKRRGLVYPSGDIYGGLRGFWDYGPLGAQLKKNIKDIWWHNNISCTPVHPQTRQPLVVLPLDGSIITNPKVWEASGHVATFADEYVDCKTCKGHFRTDQISSTECPEGKMQGKPVRYQVGKLPICQLTEPRRFDLMYKTESGSVEGDKTMVYLRPETAQSIFANFLNVTDTNRVKVPFGIAQVGKAFRNEVTPRNFTFRSREFEQMEIEFFCRPDEATEYFQFWIQNHLEWWEKLGIRRNSLRTVFQNPDELAHYAKGGAGVCDIEYEFPFGWGEIEGIAHRTDFDLKQHELHSGKKMDYFDDSRNARYHPHVIEPSAGLDRGVLAVICDAFTPDETRPSKMFMKFAATVAPVKFAIFPLVNKPDVCSIAENMFNVYRRQYSCVFDAKQNIGKRYARMDEIGAPFCVTVDFDTLHDNKVTVRFRDTMQQERMSFDELETFLSNEMRQ